MGFDLELRVIDGTSVYIEERHVIESVMYSDHPQRQILSLTYLISKWHPLG